MLPPIPASAVVPAVPTACPTTIAQPMDECQRARVQRHECRRRRSARALHDNRHHNPDPGKHPFRGRAGEVVDAQQKHPDSTQELHDRGCAHWFLP